MGAKTAQPAMATEATITRIAEVALLELTRSVEQRELVVQLAVQVGL